MTLHLRLRVVLAALSTALLLLPAARSIGQKLDSAPVPAHHPSCRSHRIAEAPPEPPIIAPVAAPAPAPERMQLASGEKPAAGPEPLPIALFVVIAGELRAPPVVV